MRAGNRLPGWEQRLNDGLFRLRSLTKGREGVKKEDRPKFVGYHDLLKLLANPECPACFIVRRSLRGFVSMAFIEELTVPEFREPLRAARGYCRDHSVYMREGAKNWLRKMGVAIVLEDLLALVQEKMRTNETVPPVAECPLCRLQKDISDYAVQLIADYCQDNEFQEHYDSSTGVCLPHLREILRLLDGEGKTFIISSHERKLDHALGHLREFIRKHDYRFLHEKITPEEAESWKNAVEFVVGR